MRVLVVSDVSGYMPGGVPAETVHLLKGLRARGHDVAIAGDIALGGEGIGHYAITLPVGERIIEELQAALAKFRPDIVHVMAMSAPGIARLQSLLATQAWLFTCHSAPPYERKVAWFHANETLHYAARALRYLPNTLLWRWVLSRQVMPAVVVHSAFVRDIVVRYGCHPDRAVIIPLGYDALTQSVEWVRAPIGDAPQFVTVAGIAHTKGQHDAIAALAQVVRRYPRACHRFIGEARDPSYTAFLNERIERLGLRHNVEFLHGLSNADKDALLCKAHVYVQPSHEEGFCLAFIEAAAIVPRLVGTATGAIRAMCEGDPLAAAVPARAPDALAAAILKLLDCEAAHSALTVRSRRLADVFAWSSYINAHEALYDRVGRAHGVGHQSAQRGTQAKAIAARDDTKAPTLRS